MCGNGLIEDGEVCDTPTLGGATCISEGFDDGSLACTATCDALDTSGCGSCGNFIVDGDEECDEGDTLPTEVCTDQCMFVRRTIFVTSAVYDAALGGVAGADTLCQTFADNANLPGTYLAWLSDDTVSPATRMTQPTTPYVRTDGMQIAPNWTGLVDGSIDVPINLTETGAPGPVGSGCESKVGDLPVWSGTTLLGESLGSTCTNFTSNANAEARWANGNRMDGAWTAVCGSNINGACALTAAFYCVQQ